MTGSQSWHAENAERQRREVRRRLAEACATIRSEIKATYDGRTGLCRYPVNNGKLTEAEVLRRASVDKNTIKREYHARARETVRRLISWADSKTTARAEATFASGSVAETTELELARRQRDDIAERYAVLEMQLGDAVRAKETIERAMAGKDDFITELKEKVVRLTAIIVGLEPTGGPNVLPHPTLTNRRSPRDAS